MPNGEHWNYVLLVSAACPIGSTIDEDGKTCIKCPADEYWVNPTACEPCPNNGTTEGKTGVTGVEFCKGEFLFRSK